MSNETATSNVQAAAANNAVEAGVTTTKKEGAVEYKPMAIVDRKINNVIFETKVNIATFYSKEKDKSYCIITLGQEQDKKFAVYARKDGKGVCCMTDFEDYQIQKAKKAAVTV